MFGHGGGAAALALDARFVALPAPAAVPTPGVVGRAATRIGEFDPVVDLGARIGSREWFRGAATCLTLCATAVSLAPGLGPILDLGPALLPESQWQEARALAISPLAYGADTGRRMGATDAVQPLTDTPERPSIELSATLGQGDGFARVLERAGVAHAQAREVADMVAGVVPLDGLSSGTRMEVVLGRRANRTVARPLDSLLFRARFDLQLAVERVDGALRLRRLPIAVDDTPLRVQGRVGDSLFRSARAAGAPASAVQAYIKAVGGRMSLGSVGSDARFDLVLAHRRAQTGEVEVGELLYAGLEQGRRQTRMLRWTVGGKPQWFEASGVGERRGVMRMPVVGRQTSSFGMRRHPLLGYSRMHAGLDFGAPQGAPIVAATDGVVSFAGRHGGHGNYVKLAHSGGIATGYAHMSRIAVHVGARVSQGQVIGYVGSTGLSTGPHLHYEVYRNNIAINPRSISFITTSQLAGADLARFRATLARLTSVRPGAAMASVPARPAEKTAATKPAESRPAA
ncbi:MAG: peptidase [Sphingomonas bacterium]|nr:peptidase [Sphingomonas bacterium]